MILGSLRKKSLNKYKSVLATPVRYETKNAAVIKERNKWNDSRSYSESPTESAFKFLQRFIPGNPKRNKDISEMFDSIKNEYGNIFRMPGLFGRHDVLLISSPRDMETVFRNEGIWPRREGTPILMYYREKVRRDFFQGVEGLMTSQNEQWAKFRTAVNPVLMKPQSTQYYIQRLSEVNIDFINRIKEVRNKNTLEVPENFEYEINNWTLESISLIAMDKELGLLKSYNVNEQANKLRKSLQAFFQLMYELDIKPSIWRWVATPKYKAMIKALDTILETTSHFIDESVEKLDKQQNLKVETAKQSVLEQLLKIDRKVAKVMAMDMMFAGVDTASSTLAGILINLSKNPEKQNILREEILKILPEKDSKFTDSSFDNMPYLKACIKESMRIYPLVSAHDRMVNTNCVLSGYQVPKGTEVFMHARVATKDPQYFVNPDVYLPERWLRQNKNLRPTDPFAFLPFGFGPRTCIGKRIVDLELEIAVARIIRNFKVDFNYPIDKAFHVNVIMIPAIPLRFKFTDV